MYPPIGWQNLATSKQKTFERSLILPAVRAVHPAAQESEINEGILGYWMTDSTPSRLIGLAWADDSKRWSYAIMSKVAFDIGLQCSVYPISDNRYRVLPCRADETPTIHRQLQAARARLKRLKPRVIAVGPEAFLYDDGDGWHVSVEAPDGSILKDAGPYLTYEAASAAVPALIEQVLAPISVSE